jgi:competence protein ComEA
VALSFGEPDASQRIDLNRADVWLLTALPGIGAVTAQRIVDYRQANGPYRSLSDLLKVEGIGQATLDKIAGYVTVGGD